MLIIDGTTQGKILSLLNVVSAWLSGLTAFTTIHKKLSQLNVVSEGSGVMELVTLKQFADDQGITYEAVRRQVIRHADKLQGHIVKKDRTQYLDDEAVKILKERRRENRIVMQTIDQSDEIGRLTDQLESLKAQLMTAQNELLKEKDRIISLQGELREGIEERTKYAALLEDAQDKERRLAEAEKQLSADKETIDSLRRERDSAQKDAQAFQKSFFGFYRKKY